MIIARQGMRTTSCYPMVGLFLAVLFFLSVDGLASCISYNSGNIQLGNSISCQYGRCGTGANLCSSTALCGDCPSVLQSGSYYFINGRNVNVSEPLCTNASSCWNHSAFQTCSYSTRCSSQCEADSLVCINAGKEWIPGSGGECGTCNDCDEQCQCEEQGMIWTGTECIEDTTICAEDRAACTGVGGKFDGSVMGTGDNKCCSSVCDLCSNNASRNVFRLKRQECCSQNQAPPDPESQCSTPIQSGCGMTTSQWTDPSSNDWNCQDPNNSPSTMSRYTEMCSDDYDDDFGSSDSEPGSSSSECQGEGCSSSSYSSSSYSSSSNGSSSSGEGDGDCPECPLLEDIRDVLGSIDGTTADILLCLQIPHLCPALDVDIDFDEVTDTLHNMHLTILDIRQMMDKLAENDSVTWTKFDALGNVIDTSIHVMNDTTRKWLKGIADSLGIGTDSLIAHLDSIMRTIPDTVLDSILKYQKYASDNYDSVLYGSGKGFSLIDSLIDSSVKYFKESSQKWDEYNSVFADSMGSINGTLDGIPNRNASAIGFMLGYEDTASTNLRGDLNGIKDAIDGIGGLLDSGDGSGVDSSGLGGWRDSIGKYFIGDDRFDSLVDSTASAWGVDSLDESWDASYAYGLCEGDSCPPCTDDSCMGSLSANFVLKADSIARLAGDSLEASTKRQRDSLPSFWDSTFKELKEYSWFGSFDSTFLANIGAKIPNSNTCPEHCFAMDVNGTYAYVGYNMHLDWKLCRPIAPDVLNSLNAFDILKLLARILTVVTCLSIIMWEVSSRRGGGIGL